MERLENFIKKILGNKYSLKAGNLFKKKCTTDGDIESIAEDKTFFCSELVASAWKCLGILPRDVAASQYWPGSFGQGAQIKLEKGARLDDEMHIIFDRMT